MCELMVIQQNGWRENLRGMTQGRKCAVGDCDVVDRVAIGFNDEGCDVVVNKAS